ncbi:MAG: PAS domain-containing protein [Thermoanaerobaculia bacterium]
MNSLQEPAFDLSTRQYFRLLEGLKQAVIGTGGDGNVILWSKEAEALYGWSGEEVLGLSILEVTPTDVSKSRAAEIMKTLGEGRVWSGSFGVRTKGGRTFEVSVTDIPLMNADHQVAGVIGVSALTDALTYVAAAMSELAAACDLVWPGRVSVKVFDKVPGVITASKPHVTQLLALTLSRFIETLREGTAVEISVRSADGSPFTDFNLTKRSDSGVYIQIAERLEQQTYGILRGLLRPAQSTEFAAVLVNMVGGHMIVGATDTGPSSIHLLLPGRAGA